ncbi:hypothetical protein [Kitasatospora aureofaciens]|uniref:hypothetical protein n=1 Tax=Kitasatospora aureofaciens TaxID=1894 RepID=UPI001D468C13|nr:hypothetical protein [Kitasatospora aureofaciens]HJD80224.1 hypothetical protein [Kitasatospora aureofaciens]
MPATTGSSSASATRSSRCRCATEWHEPDLARAYFDQHFTAPEHEWDDFDTAMRALAFDGLLAGATWE